MAVTREEVLHIAALARIRLEESRVDTLASELNSILKHIEVLSSAETGTVKGIAESKAGTPLRETSARRRQCPPGSNRSRRK
jgi:Asp-tRNAAsn/Glu-tRNAGln amidotransferase C subunit